MGAKKSSLERGQFNHFETYEVNELVFEIVLEFLPGVTRESRLVRRLAKALAAPGGSSAAIAGDLMPDEAVARLEAVGAEIDPTFLRGKWLPPRPDDECELLEITLAGGEWDEPERVKFWVRFFDGKHRYFADGCEVHASRLPLTASGFLDAILTGRMGSGIERGITWDVYGERIPWGVNGASVYTEVLIDDPKWEEVFADRDDYGDFASPWDAEDSGDAEDEDEAWETEDDEEFADRVGIQLGGVDEAS